MNKTLSYAVTGQRIEVTETAMLVAGTVNIYTAHFAFDAEWDGLQRTAVFTSSDNSTTITREQLLTDGACTVPWEVLVAGNRLRVGVYGTKADGTRLPTIWTERRLYINPGAGPSQEAADPSPTLVEQLLAKIGDMDSLKTEDKSSLVAAINETLESGGGSGGGTTDHNKLTNRDADDQHPMRAITGLVKALEGKQTAGDYLTQETDPTVPAWAKEPTKPSYTASEVGADPSGTAASQVAAHDTGTDAHRDIRLLISSLADRINALADSDDDTLDQMSEVVAYIKSNRTLIEAITTSKVSVADIVDNLTTNASNKPMSAAQGVALKALIDAISVPDKLPNPNALTFTGAVSGSYDGSAPLNLEIPSGGEPAEKTWTYLGEYDLSVANRISLTDLSNITEIYLIWADVKNGLTNVSGMLASINDIPVASGIIPVNTTTTVYGWSHLVYNGLYWDSTHSVGYKDSENVSLNTSNAMAPNNHVLDVGPAQSISLYQISSSWGATSGTIEIYVR